MSQMRSIREIAKLRDECILRDRRRRILARKARRIAQLQEKETTSDENVEKVRALIAAIRAHTNTDIVLDVKMKADLLFSLALDAMSGNNATDSSTETKFLGEALTCVQALNKIISKR